MSIVTLKDENKPVFLSVEYQHGGQFKGMYQATYVKGKKSEAATRKAEAEGRWNYLAKYFEHMFGSKSLKHFMQEAIKEGMG